MAFGRLFVVVYLWGNSYIANVFNVFLMFWLRAEAPLIACIIVKAQYPLKLRSHIHTTLVP